MITLTKQMKSKMKKTIKVSKEYHKLYKKILKARNILTQKLMKEPSTKELSQFLEIDEKIINEVMKYQEKIKSLEEETKENELTLLDKISLDENIIDDYHILLKDELNKLEKDEYNLIKMRYFEDRSKQEIASFLGTNQVKISRNEQKILKKLKNNLSKAY